MLTIAQQRIVLCDEEKDEKNERKRGEAESEEMNNMKKTEKRMRGVGINPAKTECRALDRLHSFHQ